MKQQSIDVVVCLDHRPATREFNDIVSALSQVRGVRGVTLNDHVTRLVNVRYNPDETRARTILDGVMRSGHEKAYLVGM